MEGRAGGTWRVVVEGSVNDETRDLARRAREGDLTAFEALVRGRRERAILTAYQILGDWEEARDVAQNAFLKVWQQIGTYDESYPFDTWLRRIVTNQAIDHYRKGRARRETVEKATREELRGRRGAEERSEVERLFEEAAAHLPAQQRAVFVMREIEDMSPREISTTLGIAESTVRNHLFKARVTLQAWFQEHYPEYRPGRSGTGSRDGGE